MNAELQKISLLASGNVDNIEKLCQLLEMQMNLISKMAFISNTGNKRTLTMKVQEVAVKNMRDERLIPQWRLMTTNIHGEFEFQVSHFNKVEETNEVKEYPLYQLVGNSSTIKTAMVGAGVESDEVRNLFIT